MSARLAAYRAIRPELRTGDVVLFSGRGVISGVVRLLSGSRWSHCGMVFQVSAIDALLVWESTSLTAIPDATTGRITNGVQLTLLSQRVQTDRKSVV